MKKIFFLIVVLFAIQNAYSELKFKNIGNGIIELQYKSEGQFFNGEELFARLYAFDIKNPLPKAYEFELKYVNNSYKVKFKLPDNRVYFLLNITNGKIVDNNHSKFYSYMPNDKLMNANYVAAMTYLGGLPDNINRRVNYRKAVEHLEQEIKLYPKNITALVAYYSLLFDLKKIDFDNYIKKMEEVLNYKFDEDDENQIKSITRALRILNKNEEANKIESNFIKKHPNSTLAEENYLSMLSQVDNLKEFSEKTLNYLKQFPEGTNRERIFSALVSGYLQTGDYKSILKILDNLKNVPPTAYSQIAFTIFNDDKFDKIDIDERIKLVIDLIKKAIDIAENDDGSNKPDYISKSEWQERLKQLIAGFYEEYGQILMAIEEFDLALDKYKISLDLYKEKAPLSLYENTMNLCIKLDLPETAFEIGLLAYEYNFPSDDIRNLMKELHDKLNKSSSFEVFETKLIISAQNERFKKYDYETLDEELANIKLVDIDNNYHYIKSDTGKVVMIAFWSSWCDPCDVALSAVDSLSTFYKGNNNIRIATVNIWETEENRRELVKKYFSESKPDFYIYIDLEDETPYNFDISGLPFFCLIGKDGKIKFVEQGFKSNSFIDSYKDKIEYLLR